MVSRLSLGTVQFGMPYGLTRAKSQSEVDALLDAAADLGVSLLDTAPAYGDSEAKIGDALRRRPGHGFLLATKAAKLVPDDAASADRMVASLGASLEKSRASLGRLDILQLHQTEPWLLGSDSLWEAVEELRSRGHFRSFGVSVYEPEEALHLLERRAGAVDHIQLPFNVLDQRFRPAIQAASRAGVGVLARSAFLKGTLTADDASLPPFLAALTPHRERLARCAAAVGLSAAEAALTFVAGEPGVSSVLVGVDNPSELRRNVAVLERLGDAGSIREELKAMSVSDPALVDPRTWTAKGF